jgi:hypothetical protein
MPDFEGLIIRIERAKRFAAAMTNHAERERFATIVAEYERELAAIEDDDVQIATYAANLRWQ